MNNAQLYLAIGVPILFNGFMLSLLNSHFHKLIDLQDKLFVERLKNMESVIDARLRLIAEKLGIGK
jgi:hypothetical protein